MSLRCVDCNRIVGNCGDIHSCKGEELRFALAVKEDYQGTAIVPPALQTKGTVQFGMDAPWGVAAPEKPYQPYGVPKTQRGLLLGKGILYALVAALLLSAGANLWLAITHKTNIAVAIPSNFCGPAI